MKKALKVSAIILAIGVYFGGMGYVMTTDFSVKFEQEK